jgi:hypothetical protein
MPPRDAQTPAVGAEAATGEDITGAAAEAGSEEEEDTGEARPATI